MKDCPGHTYKLPKWCTCHFQGDPTMRHPVTLQCSNCGGFPQNEDGQKQIEDYNKRWTIRAETQALACKAENCNARDVLKERLQVLRSEDG